MAPGCGAAAQLCQMSGALLCCATASRECSVCGSGPTSCAVDPATSVSTSAKGRPDPLPKYHPQGRCPAVDELCLEGCPVPQLLGPTFSFLPCRQKLSGLAVLPWPKSKAVRQGLAGFICSPLFLLPTAPEGRGATFSWEELQWSIPLPHSPPRMSLGSASNILLSKTDAAWRSLGLVSPWEDTSQLGTIWSPSGPTLCSKQGLRSWWGFAVSIDLCHPNFSPLSAQQV